jgi:hypothetical protein
MTRLEIMAKAFASFSPRSEKDILNWALENMSPNVAASLGQQVPAEQAEKLLAEIAADPSAVLSSIVTGLFAKSETGK